MQCGRCGGFYNQACPHWPQCTPWQESEAEAWIDWGFRVYFAVLSGANFTVLCMIWVKL